MEYRRYNTQFQKWFDRTYGKTKVLEYHVREYVQSYIDGGKNTSVLIAALKFRFNECENKAFSFKHLNKPSDIPHSHKAMSRET